MTGGGTGARVWAMRAPGDWTAEVRFLRRGDLGHGADPVPGAFGAGRLTTGDAVGHTGSFAPGTRSLTNLAASGTGTYGSAELR